MKLKNKIILLLAIVVVLSGCYPMTTKASSDNTIQNGCRSVRTELTVDPHRRAKLIIVWTLSRLKLLR